MTSSNTIGEPAKSLRLNLKSEQFRTVHSYALIKKISILVAPTGWGYFQLYNILLIILFKVSSWLALIIIFICFGGDAANGAGKTYDAQKLHLCAHICGCIAHLISIQQTYHSKRTLNKKHYMQKETLIFSFDNSKYACKQTEAFFCKVMYSNKKIKHKLVTMR